jgi:hypothetical protein
MGRRDNSVRKQLGRLFFSRQLFIIFARSCHRSLRHLCCEKRKLTGRVASLQMNRGPQFAVIAVALVLAFNMGCAKKKPQLPPQAKAPAETIATPLPSEISETVPPPPPPEPQPQPQPSESTVIKPPKKHSRKKITPPTASVQAANPTNTATPPASAAPAPSNTTVAAAHSPANPAGEPTPDVAISPDVTSAQLLHQKQSTAQLLEETEKTINGMKAQGPAQEETLAEIRSYVNQSRKATSEGDFERAYNLATKAHLLSDALVKK